MSNYTLTTPSYTHTQETVKGAEGNNIQRLGVTKKDCTHKEKYSNQKLKTYSSSYFLKQHTQKNTGDCDFSISKQQMFNYKIRNIKVLFKHE